MQWFDFGGGAGSHTVTYAVPLGLGLQVAETTIPFAFAVLVKNRCLFLTLVQHATTGVRSIRKTMEVSKSGSKHWENDPGALGPKTHKNKAIAYRPTTLKKKKSGFSGPQEMAQSKSACRASMRT